MALFSWLNWIANVLVQAKYWGWGRVANWRAVFCRAQCQCSAAVSTTAVRFHSSQQKCSLLHGIPKHAVIVLQIKIYMA